MAQCLYPQVESVFFSEMKIQGRKFQAVNCVLKLFTMVVNKYMRDMIECGWDDCQWSENVCGEKKIMLATSMEPTLSLGAAAAAAPPSLIAVRFT